MTHEEAVTQHVAQVVRSYRQLPFSLYHFQIKERDEPRPRAGLLRTREFIMKDAYTFDRDKEGLDAHYERYREAYDRVMERCGIEWYRVESDVGAMGGHGAHEYMAPSPAGENDVALAPGYAANVEVASADARPVELPPGLDAPELVETPGLVTVSDVAGRFDVRAGALLKAYPVMVEDRGLLLVMVRGDHRVNDIKLQNALGASFRPARAEEFADRIGPAGYIGPVGIDVPILLDDAVEPGAYITGANRDNAHLRGVEPGRDFPFKRGDVRSVEAGDTVGGHPIRIEPAIEVGNIFKLGTRYSDPLGASYLDESRQLAADLDGLLRARARAPGRGRRRAVRRRAGHLVAGLDGALRRAPRRPRQGRQRGARGRRAPLRGAARGRPGDDLRRPRRRPGREVRGRRAARRAAAADRRPAHARQRRDRGAGPPRPRDPLHPRRGRRRRGGGAVAQPPVGDDARGRRTPREAGQDAVARAQETAEKARLTFRRLSGLDRSGPPPPQTLSGQPLNPWTIPNAIGYIRLGADPGLPGLRVLLGRRRQPRGRDHLRRRSRWSDYLDGIAARLTGQYSRMGALLDPAVDRLLIISGVAVCWYFELLPRWALAILVARELFMVGLVRWGLRRHLDAKVNWLGRAGVWPVMGALFFGMAGLATLGEICLYVGLVLVLGSTAQYLREAVRMTRAQQGSSSA